MRKNLGSDPGQRNDLNYSWNGVWDTKNSFDNDYEIKKPLKLEALPLLDDKDGRRIQKRDTLGLT